MAQQGPNPIEIYEATVQSMQAIISGVRTDQLNASTPCTEWDVQSLINHNIKVSQFFNGILTGAGGINPMEVNVPLPSEGAAAAFEAATNGLLTSAKATDPQKVIEAPFGSMPAGQLMMIPFADMFIHKWDLGKATGQETSMDSGLAEACYHFIEHMLEGGRDPNNFADAVIVPASASIQDKLLGISGRQPQLNFHRKGVNNGTTRRQSHRAIRSCGSGISANSFRSEAGPNAGVYALQRVERPAIDYPQHQGIRICVRRAGREYYG